MSAVKKSQEIILCKECGKETLRFPNLSYNQPRKFCSHPCSVLYHKKTRGKGKYHYLWKGDEAKYTTKHTWIYRNHGKANKCEFNKEHTGREYQWANISGEYKRDISDYRQLCRSCHAKYDHLRLYGDRCRRGHIRAIESLRKSSKGKWKECPVCRRERENA